jgi:3-oxoadipate enol-lactonase
MPEARITPDLLMHYEVDDYTDPWTQADTILMVHGNAESGLSWFGWVPPLAREFRIVRPDTRGYGASTPMPRGFAWSLDVIVDDHLALMDQLGIERFHLVGAKLGGTIGRHFAARAPDRVKTLTVVGTPTPFRKGVKERVPELVAEFERDGLEAWVRRNMQGRLGSGFPPEGVEWWTKFMARAPVSSQVGFCANIAPADITACLPRIACPTLVITTERSALGTVEETRAWQTQIPRSELLVLAGDSYHVAASHSEECALAMKAFILRNAAS